MNKVIQLLGSMSTLIVMFVPTYINIFIWGGLKPETFYQKFVLILTFIIVAPIQLLFLLLGTVLLFSINRK